MVQTGKIALAHILAVFAFSNFWGVLCNQDEFHLSCKDKTLTVSGPLAEVHAECSKNLTPEQEANLCEMQCVRKKEELMDDKGIPSPEKHEKYTEKLAGGDLGNTIKKKLMECFEKHGAGVKPMEEDPNCETAKALNECHKNAMMNICSDM